MRSLAEAERVAREFLQAHFPEPSPPPPAGGVHGESARATVLRILRKDSATSVRGHGLWEFEAPFVGRDEAPE